MDRVLGEGYLAQQYTRQAGSAFQVARKGLDGADRKDSTSRCAWRQHYLAQRARLDWIAQWGACGTNVPVLAKVAAQSASGLANHRWSQRPALTCAM